MRRRLFRASHFLSAALISLVLAGCTEPEVVVDTWEGGEHDVAVKVETLEDGGTRVKASYGYLGEQTLEDLTEKAVRSADAAMALGVLYWYGAGPENPAGPRTLPANKTKAMGFYRQAAVNGLIPAKLILADIYASGASGIEQNFDEATRLYFEAAEAGEVRAQCRLVDMYETGQGIQQNLSEAVQWYQGCAQSGDGAAMLRLAELYETGEGISEDKTAAVEWYRKAIQANQPRAICRLAVLYDIGEGVVRDLSEAAKLYQVCAKSGDGQAMFRLAQLYETGQGVPADWSMALKWYRSCVESGIGPAMFRLAEIYDNTLGTDNDPSLAADYMLRALKANVQQAKDQMLSGAKAWSGEFRQEFQRKLKTENLYAGPIDGILGRSTKRAIETLSSDNS